MAQLSLSTRPRRFSNMIGQQQVTSELTEYYGEHDTLPTCVMFAGPPGVGKTSIARICTLSLECPHSTTFGHPCKECSWAFTNPEKYDFPDDVALDLSEINCADTKIDEIRSIMQGAHYAPNNGANYRNYILDEFQVLGKASQKLLLKYFEDCPETTRFYVCTTEPGQLIEAIAQRCVPYWLRKLNSGEVLQLVEGLLLKSKSDLDPSLLAEALDERQIASPRAINQAVTKYLSGATPAEAVVVAGLGALNTDLVVRHVRKGNWEALAPILHDLDAEQARVCRRDTVNYLKGILLQDTSPDKCKLASEGIARLTQITALDDSVAHAAISAGLYDVTSMFGNV